ncbi:MAG: histidine kinase [Pygmaiobacter sp.]|nr:histidine kinase [Pygmaiobacter sp.]
MKKLRCWFSRLKLRYKLILAIYTVLFPVLIVCAAVLYWLDYTNTMRENTRLYERFTQNICTEIGYLQADVVDIATYFAVNSEVKTLLEASAAQPPQSALFWYEETPVAFLQNILAIKSHIKTLILYPENGFAPFYISRDASVHDTNLANLREQPLYRAASEARGDIVWARVAADSGFYLKNKGDKIVASRELYDLAKRRPLGFLVLGMDAGEYVRICQRSLQEPNEGIVVLSGQGDEFVTVGQISEEARAAIRDPATQAQLAKNGSTSLSAGGDYLFCCASKDTGVQVYYCSPRQNWVRSARGTLVLPLVLALVLMLASIPLSAALARVTLRGPRALCDSMAKFRQGDFTQRVPVTTQDEIGVLSAAFNKMVCDIRELIDKTYVLQLKEREIELDVLQAQINPHFLYNVLDSLYWQAETAGNEELSENILALSRMFRLLLNQGASKSTVGQEVALINCYLQIQKMRFGGRLHYTVTVDPALLDCPLPKLTLQPFVENAVVHGVEQSEQGGSIWLTGQPDGAQMRFVVGDDGVGMAQTVADALLNADAPPKAGSAAIGHYAICNIRQRLELEYPGRYTLRLHSEIGCGTRVELALPMEPPPEPPTELPAAPPPVAPPPAANEKEEAPHGERE